MDRKPRKLNHGSFYERLSGIHLGERHYVECELDEYQRIQSRALQIGRLPEAISHMRFKTQLVTAVAAGRAGDIRYLVCIERTE